MAPIEAPELVTLVNEDGVTIGKMERAAMGPDDRCLAVVIWLTNPAGEVLIAQRSNTVHVNPGLWSAAAEGIVTFGDTAVDTANREVAEELGIQDVELKAIPGRILHGSSRGKRCKIGFHGSIDMPIASLQLQAEEVAAAKFISLEKLKQEWAQHPEKFVSHLGLYLAHFDGAH